MTQSTGGEMTLAEKLSIHGTCRQELVETAILVRQQYELISCTSPDTGGDYQRGRKTDSHHMECCIDLCGYLPPLNSRQRIKVENWAMDPRTKWNDRTMAIRSFLVKIPDDVFTNMIPVYRARM
jgi:hypothetical protein